jgi:hypothetical protein
METVRQNTPHLTAWLQRSATSGWYALRDPRLTIAAIVALVVVSLLGWLLPQQASPTVDAATWTVTLPVWLQRWGEPLFFLGLGRIFRSLWFWLPLALLLLNSLIALADYGPGSWRRLGKTIPPIEWQHARAQRVQQVVRLPKSPDAFLDSLRTSLAEEGFSFYMPDEAEERMVGAALRRWAWLGLLAIYGGLVLLIGAVLISNAWLRIDRFSLAPLEPVSSSLFNGEFELAEAEAGEQVGQVTYRADRSGSSAQPLAWSLYRPALFNNVVILPIEVEPVLSVIVRDAADAPVKLIPVQEDLPPGDRLNFSLAGTGAPLYFLIPANSLAVQILPDPASPEHYRVRVRRGSETPSSEDIEAQLGQPFVLEGLSVTATLGHKLEVIAYRDPAIALYLLGFGLIGVGLVFTYVRPPVQLWLIPDIKGLGGQLYGVIEQPGSLERAARFLEQLFRQAAPADSDDPMI